MPEWIKAQWNDIKGNVKYALLLFLIGGIVAGAAVLVDGLPWWKEAVLVFLFVSLSLWAAVATWWRVKQTDLKNLIAKQVKEIEATIPSIMVNGIPVAGPAAQVAPHLRSRIIAVCDELHAFLIEHGSEPKIERRLQESSEDYMGRFRLNVMPWREKFLGDYRLKFGASVPRIRDEIRVRSGMSDTYLDQHISRAQANPNGDIEAVEAIRKSFWKMAYDMSD